MPVESMVLTGNRFYKEHLFKIKTKISGAYNLTVQTVNGKVDLTDQYHCPTGRHGRLLATLMNRNHEPLTLWGLSKVDIGSNDVILDIGCGGGKTVNRLARFATRRKVYGIDHSAEMVRFSKKVNKTLILQNRVKIVEGCVEKMSFDPNFFDLVTGFETDYFWSNFQSALKEITRVLKPGGKLLLVNECGYNAKNAKMMEDLKGHLLSPEEIHYIMESVGLGGFQLFAKAESSWNAILAQKQFF